MNEKIKNAYDRMVILLNHTMDNEVMVLVSFEDIPGFLGTKMLCSRYAKFLINDVQNVVNEFGESFYETVDPKKLAVLFSIAEQYQWFTRADLISFVKFKMGERHRW